MPPTNGRIKKFRLPAGRVIADKYIIDRRLGGGWEGDVYRVVEKRTGICRAAKFFYPHRNVRDKAVRFYAKKLDHLRKCSIVIQYLHTETIEYRNQPVTCLISELVDGMILSRFIRRQPGRRMRPFEALHLTYALAKGLEDVHHAREYHGDLHADNVLVNRSGIFFDVKIVDFFHWGAATRTHMKDDVADLVRLLYDSVGGRARYADQPTAIKSICRGLRRDLITKQFPTARHLREHLESFAWDE